MNNDQLTKRTIKSINRRIDQRTNQRAQDEVELATVALIAATRFFPRLVQRPDPPKPYPASYSYEPQVLDLADLEAFGGRGDGVETQAVGKIPEAAVGARAGRRARRRRSSSSGTDEVLPQGSKVGILCFPGEVDD